jgi:hypothetical protein
VGGRTNLRWGAPALDSGGKPDPQSRCVALATRVGEARTSSQPPVETTEPAGVCLQTGCPRSLDAVSRELEVHHLTQVSVQSVRAKRPPGRPAKSAEPTPVQGYRLQATLARTETAEETFSRQRSRFILATNQLDKTLWPAQKCLREYKGQQTVERGFRFLKDPLFFASSVFVKKPQRVEALALIMALTLMVYTLAERKLRQALEAQNQTVLDQRKQPTAKPTFRWIMQKFQGIHWVNLNGQRQISNLNDERRFIIHLLGPLVERYYHASG